MVSKYLLISDIHDNKESIGKLAEKHKDNHFNAIFFCGDAVAPFTLNFLIEQFYEKTDKIFMVLGNNEGEVYKISRDFSNLETEKVFFSPNFLFTKIETFSVLLTHGWEDVYKTRRIIESLGKSGDYDFIFFGHTHIPELILVDNHNKVIRYQLSDEIKKFKLDIGEYRAIIVNPGELGGWLFGSMRYAVLDFKENIVEISFLSLQKQ